MLGAGDLVALGERFSTGRLSARDMLAVLAAGLRGGGESFSDEDAGSLSAEGGIGELARIVTELLAVTFLVRKPNGTSERRACRKPPLAAVRDPFPWDEAMHFGLGVLRLSPNRFLDHDPARTGRGGGTCPKGRCPVPR